MSEKKKVYVETTVVSDATALPTNDDLPRPATVETVDSVCGKIWKRPRGDKKGA